MKVALYYPWLYLKSGAERVVVKLLEESRHDWTLFTGRYEPESTYPELKSATIRELGGLSVKRTVRHTAANCWKVMTRRLPVEGFDALVVVCEGLGDLVLLRGARVPTINICLTPLRIAFDEVYQQQYLAGQGPLKRLGVQAGAAAFRVFDRAAWRRYDHVFCISEEVKRRAVQGALPGAADAEVLHVGLGVLPQEPGERYDRYFLLPGRMMWTKNLELGVDAFRKMRESSPDLGEFRLVIAGYVDVKSRAYAAKLRQAAAGMPVEFLEDPTDSELEQLYRNCRAVLFTALNEDWGMTPLEGMSFGKPAIAVNRGGPRESINDKVGGFLEDPVPEAFAGRMAQLAADESLARTMGTAGREHVKRFSWSRFAGRVDEVLDHVAAKAAADRSFGRERASATS